MMSEAAAAPVAPAAVSVDTSSAAPLPAQPPAPAATLAARDKAIRAKLRNSTEPKPAPEGAAEAPADQANAEPAAEAKPDEPKTAEQAEPAKDGDEAGKRLDFAKWEKKLRKTEQQIEAAQAAFSAQMELLRTDPIAGMKAIGFDLRAWVDGEIKRSGLSPEDLQREQLASEMGQTKAELEALKKALDESRNESAKDRALRNSAARLARVDWAQFPHLSAHGEEEGAEMVIATVQDFERRGLDFDDAIVAIESELKAQDDRAKARLERIYGGAPAVPAPAAVAAPPRARASEAEPPGTVTSRVAGAAGLPPPTSLRELDARARAMVRASRSA